MDILDGVALERVATPPLMLNAKSATSSAPLPPLVLKTASLMVTAIVELLEARDTPEIIGKTLSFNETELLLCEVDASLPAAS